MAGNSLGPAGETSGTRLRKSSMMSRYYLQLRNHAGEMLDPDGTDCFDNHTLRNVVLLNARDVIAGDVKRGVLDLSFRIDAEDASGAVVHSLPFTDAIEVTSSEDLGHKSG